MALPMALALSVFAGCAGGSPDPIEDTASVDAGVTPLSSPRLLRRMSLDLRGTLPTIAELDAVEADPSQLDGFRDAFLDDPRLEERLVSLLGEWFLTRLDQFQVVYYDYGFDEPEACGFNRSVGQEPLRLAAHLAVTDAPWSELVTADYTMADETLLSVWPLDTAEDPAASSSGWVESRYTDNRPPVGILAGNGLWWRYVTSVSNANRSRAAVISNLLLCTDLIGRPVSFSTSPSLADEDGIASALKENEACVGCHSVVDPLAAALFGFYPAIDYNPEELGYYHPERELIYRDILDVEMAFFGQPVSSLAQLGLVIASDSRYSRCAAQNLATVMWRRPVQREDFDTITTLDDAFIDGDLTIRPLLAAITDTATYRAGAVTAEAAEHENTARLIAPDLLAAAIEDLTGFSWTYDSCDQLDNDAEGYRVLAGGVDGNKVTAPQQDPGLTWALVTERVAQAAADTVVEADLLSGGTRLLDRVSTDSRPGDDAFTEQLDDLHWRLHAQRLSDAERADQEALWEAVLSISSDPATAWSAVLTAQLRDPEFVSY
ncbi:MAG: hypothetical protein P8R54_04880 [Myxococcota bacterium]|nr:hypothetical protein [Myxococcota bacterium]